MGPSVGGVLYGPWTDGPVRAVETTGVVSTGAGALVTTAEAGAYCDVDPTDSARSDLLMDMVEAATQRIEGIHGICGQWFRRTNVTARFPLSRAGMTLDYELLGGKPATEPQATVGASVGHGTLPSVTSHGTRVGSDGRTVMRVETGAVPADADEDERFELRIAYAVGQLSDAPAVVKQAVLRLTAHLWQNRDPAVDAKLDWDDLTRLLAPFSVKTGFER